jgi:hypothetical protein
MFLLYSFPPFFSQFWYLPIVYPKKHICFVQGSVTERRKDNPCAQDRLRSMTQD